MLKRWLVWAALAFVAYGVWAILSKAVGDELSPAQLQALSTIGMLPVIVALAWLKRPADPGDRRRGTLVALLGGAISCLGNLPYFQALGGEGAKAAAVVPLTALYPLVTVLLAVTLLRERLGRVQAFGIVLSLAGIYLLNVSNEQELLSAWLLLALAAVVLWGIAGFLQKVSTADVSSNTAAVWFLAAFVPMGVVIAIGQPLSTNPTWQLWALTAGMGFALAFGNYAVTVAYASGKASIVTPIVSLYPVFSIPAAIVLFGERIGWRETLGIVVALVSIAALTYEPARPSPEPASPGASQP
jgi:drug/metabolite transporter (DMT)-like permease